MRSRRISKSSEPIFILQTRGLEGYFPIRRTVRASSNNKQNIKKKKKISERRCACDSSKANAREVVFLGSSFVGVGFSFRGTSSNRAYQKKKRKKKKFAHGRGFHNCKIHCLADQKNHRRNWRRMMNEIGSEDSTTKTPPEATFI